MNATTLQQWTPTAHGLLRIVTGLIFLEHGLQKFFGFPPGQMANIPFDSMGAYAGVVELVCGLLITIGLFTRPAAFLASGTMAVAYWTAHAPQDPFPLNNGGDAAILFCFVFLYFVFAGAGPLSIDAKRSGNKG